MPGEWVLLADNCGCCCHYEIVAQIAADDGSCVCMSTIGSNTYPDNLSPAALEVEVKGTDGRVYSSGIYIGGSSGNPSFNPKEVKWACSLGEDYIVPKVVERNGTRITRTEKRVDDYGHYRVVVYTYYVEKPCKVDLDVRIAIPECSNCASGYDQLVLRVNGSEYQYPISPRYDPTGGCSQTTNCIKCYSASVTGAELCGLPFDTSEIGDVVAAGLYGTGCGYSMDADSVSAEYNGIVFGFVDPGPCMSEYCIELGLSGGDCLWNDSELSGVKAAFYEDGDYEHRVLVPFERDHDGALRARYRDCRSGLTMALDGLPYGYDYSIEQSSGCARFVLRKYIELELDYTIYTGCGGESCPDPSSILDLVGDMYDLDVGSYSDRRTISSSDGNMYIRNTFYLYSDALAGACESGSLTGNISLIGWNPDGSDYEQPIPFVRFDATHFRSSGSIMPNGFDRRTICARMDTAASDFCDDSDVTVTVYLGFKFCSVSFSVSRNAGNPDCRPICLPAVTDLEDLNVSTETGDSRYTASASISGNEIVVTVQCTGGQ